MRAGLHLEFLQVALAVSVGIAPAPSAPVATFGLRPKAISNESGVPSPSESTSPDWFNVTAVPATVSCVDRATPLFGPTE